MSYLKLAIRESLKRAVHDHLIWLLVTELAEQSWDHSVFGLDCLELRENGNLLR
jgi:hypothetical protein